MKLIDLAALLAAAPLFVAATAPRATLADGSTVQGKLVGSVAQFKGLRYAEPPLGSKRWTPPVMYSNPDTAVVVDATDFGSPCTQSNWGGGSEDCLFLNVFVPAAKIENVTNADLPVAFFIHGGAYQDGCSNLYDGTEIVSYWGGNAIVVTINYRLGVFGFLGSDQLRVQDRDGSTGNYGLQDQRMALQWVQDNIASFGGDKKRVMIYGESAGAASVTNQLTMPKAVNADLYSAAIIESGAFAVWAIQNFTLSQDAYDRLLVEIGCNDVDCLLALSASELFKASEEIKSLDKNYLYPWNPAPDMVEIFTHPYLALEQGDVKDVPLMMGSNMDEGSMFTILPRNATEAELIAHWTREYYSAEEQAIMMQMYVTDATYPEVEGDSVYWWAGERQLGDISMSCPAKNAAQQLTNSPARKNSVRLYHFEHKTGDSNYVPHTAEINYVFHDFLLLKTTTDREMADAMSSYWGNFLIDENHDPNSNVVGMKSLPIWPAYDPELDDSISMKDTVADSEVVTGLKKSECDLAIRQIDNYVRAYFPAA